MTDAGKGSPTERIDARKQNRGPAAGPANRRALIAAAREVFAADGLHAPLSAVAKRAGVGQGSLYRHFPDRLALGIAVFDENIDEIADAAADPSTTVEDLLGLVADQAAVSTGLIDLIWHGRADPRVAHLSERLAAAAGEVLARDLAAGRVDAGVELADILLAVTMLADAIARTEGDERAAVVVRVRGILRAAFAPR